MLFCDHLIYTSGIIENKTGYQVIASSVGINNKILNELEGYFFPIGIHSAEFVESRSLITINRTHVAHSITKNIGIGFDGRENTIYTHTIILTLEQFREINNDTRMLMNYHIGRLQIHEKLEKLKIDIVELDPAWDDIYKFPRSVIESFFDLVFSGKKIALYGIEQMDFIPNMLSCLPVELRRIPFSSLVVDPIRQPRFQIIQMSEYSTGAELDGYVKFDVTELVPFYKNDEDVMLERSIKYFVDLLKNKNKESIRSIFDEYSRISGSIKDKIKILTHYEQIRNTPDEKNARRFSYDILEILNNFDQDTIIKYLNRIKPFLNEEDYQKFSLHLEIDFIIKKFKDKKMNLENIIDMFHLLRHERSESRSQLLKQLVKKRQKDLRKEGSQILIDSRYYHNYGNEILQLFIEEKRLHRCILDIFKNSDFIVIYKQGIYEIIIQKAMLSEPQLVVNLLKLSVFNLNDEYDTRHFRKILNNVIQNPSFLEIVNPQLIIEISKSIFKKIQKVTNNVENAKITDSNIIQINKIIETLIDSLNYFVEKSTESIIKHEMEKTIFELEKFLREHKIATRSYYRLNSDDW